MIDGPARWYTQDEPPKGRKGMNVIVILTDSFRADHCSAYDGVGGIKTCRYAGKRVETPNFDKLAKEGTLFAHAYSGSLPTIPNRTDLWTGRYAFPFRGWQQFEHGDYLLAEILWDKGYASALITDTYHMHKPIYNCGRGFDTTIFVRGQEYDPWIVDRSIPVDLSKWHRLRGDESDELWRPRFEQYLRNRSTFKSEEDWFVARVVKEATRWLERQVKEGRRDRLFLWVDCFDPHEPWDPPEPFRSMYKEPGYQGPDLIDPVPGPVEGYLTEEELTRVRSLYAGEVSFVDKWVGVLIEAIKDLGLYDNSLIIWTTDHGEPFGEHGIVRKARPWNYEELVRIPLVIRHPEHGHGRVVEGIVQPVDLTATILDVLGIPTPLPLIFRAPRSAGTFPQDMPVARREIEIHGFSLMPLIRGEEEAVRRYAYSGHHKQQWSIQDREWRLILPIDGSKPPELYHRPDDPYDQRNVIREHEDVADRLELELRRWAASLR